MNSTTHSNNKKVKNFDATLGKLKGNITELNNLTEKRKKKPPLSIEEQFDASKRTVAAGGQLYIYDVINYYRQGFARWEGFVSAISTLWNNFLIEWNKHLSDIEMNPELIIQFYRSGKVDSARAYVEAEVKKQITESGLNESLQKLLIGSLLSSKVKQINDALGALKEFYTRYDEFRLRYSDSTVLAQVDNVYELFAIENLPFSGSKIEFTPEAKENIKNKYFVHRLRSPKEVDLYNNLIQLTKTLNLLNRELIDNCGFQGDIVGPEGLIEYTRHDTQYKFKHLVIGQILSVIPEEVLVV